LTIHAQDTLEDLNFIFPALHHVCSINFNSMFISIDLFPNLTSVSEIIVCQQNCYADWPFSSLVSVGSSLDLFSFELISDADTVLLPHLRTLNSLILNMVDFSAIHDTTVSSFPPLNSLNGTLLLTRYSYEQESAILWLDRPLLEECGVLLVNGDLWGQFS